MMHYYHPVEAYTLDFLIPCAKRLGVLRFAQELGMVSRTLLW